MRLGLALQKTAPLGVLSLTVAASAGAKSAPIRGGIDSGNYNIRQTIKVGYWPSEFSQIRGQLGHTQYAEGQTANELLFQGLFTLGLHRANPFW